MFGFIECLKHTLSRMLKSHHKKSKEINMQGWHGNFKKFGLLIKNANKQFRKKRNRSPLHPRAPLDL